jgi:hypothetical protein
MTPKYGPSNPVGLSRDPTAGHVDHAVVAVHVHPAWATEVRRDSLLGVLVAAKVDGPDIGSSSLRPSFPTFRSVPLDDRTLSPGDARDLGRFGC